MTISPFNHWQAVAPPQFYNRQKELRRLLNRLVHGGSTAIVGQPQSGKTSLLNYLLVPERRQAIIGDALDRCFFCFLDAQILSGIDQVTFWQIVLEPFIAHFPLGKVVDLYESSGANHFTIFALEKLFAILQNEGWRIVILIDEFDVLLTHPILNTVEFYGSLRSLTSRFSSLALVITTRRSLAFLNQHTQSLNPHGSPYFNIFTELRLGPLSEKGATDLLVQAGNCFNYYDHQFLFELSGLHPYLLQLAGECLWEVHHEGKKGSTRYKSATSEFYNKAINHFNDTWLTWSKPERKAVMAIALNQIFDLVEKHAIQISIQRDEVKDETYLTRKLYLRKLHSLLTEHFNQEELKLLCFHLDVDYDDLKSEGKIDKARELVQYFGRRGRISELKDEIIKQRPHISWQDEPQIALDKHLPFQQGSTVKIPNDYGPELYNLKDGGIIRETVNGEWQITQQVLLWWLADEIRRTTRSERKFEQWLGQHEFDHLLTEGEKVMWFQTITVVSNLLVKGIRSLIESFVKRFGQGIPD